MSKRAKCSTCGKRRVLTRLWVYGRTRYLCDSCEYERLRREVRHEREMQSWLDGEPESSGLRWITIGPNPDPEYVRRMMQ